MSTVVASNRGPLTVTVDADGEDRVERGGGGLVTGMVAALEEADDAVWVCAALNDRERALARRAEGGPLSGVGVDTGRLDVRMLPVDANTFRQAYTGIANSTLWYVHHLLFDRAYRPAFDAAWRKQWEGYRRYNRRFADTLAGTAGPATEVMVQDYHLFLTPGQVRERVPDTRISHFTHTPWAPVDSYRMLPDDVARELLEGMLGADLLGFHARRWADAFLDCVDDTLGLVVDGDTVTTADGRTVRTGVFPLGVDAAALHERAHRRDAERAFAELQEVVGDRAVISRVDRTELSKNIVRGLLAYREFLRAHPEWHDRVVHIAYADPSRLDLPDYREYVADVERVGAEIADEFGTDDWTPLLLDVEGDYPASLAAQRLADVVLVNPVRDGMNLVVKEGALLSEKDAAVVLSREAGAVPELGADALLVNPFDVTGTAETLHRALTMTADERSRRARNLRAASAHGDPRTWFEDQLRAVRPQDA